MTTETGTLAELNVKPGDVVECVWPGGYRYKHTIACVSDGIYYSKDTGGELGDAVPWRIVSRASDPDTPKLWRDMTREEKGALLLAAHEGKVIEYEAHGWRATAANDPGWFDDTAYRIRPEPKRETVTLRGGNFGKNGAVAWSFRHSGHIGPDTHRITFDLLDGNIPPGIYTSPEGHNIEVERING